MKNVDWLNWNVCTARNGNSDPKHDYIWLRFLRCLLLLLNLVLQLCVYGMHYITVCMCVCVLVRANLFLFKFVINLNRFCCHYLNIGPVQFPAPPADGPVESSGVIVGASGYGFVPPNSQQSKPWSANPQDLKMSESKFKLTSPFNTAHKHTHHSQKLNKTKNHKLFKIKTTHAHNTHKTHLWTNKKKNWCIT